MWKFSVVCRRLNHHILLLTQTDPCSPWVHSKNFYASFSHVPFKLTSHIMVILWCNFTRLLLDACVMHYSKGPRNSAEAQTRGLKRAKKPVLSRSQSIGHERELWYLLKWFRKMLDRDFFFHQFELYRWTKLNHLIVSLQIAE